MKKLHEIERLSPLARRRFLKGLGAALTAMGADSALRFACDEVAGGVAYAQSQGDSRPTYFIEIDLRDQWDHGHVMVAPGLATNPNLRRGAEGNKAALYYGAAELKKLTVNNRDVYLTADSLPLESHIGNVAMIDCCEVAVGEIHGHESANPLRSPGRAYSAAGGKMPMFNLDPVANFPQGCEAYYSSTPTPATFHNYRQKQIGASRNGIAFKGISRSIHTAYHFAAGLPNAELDRLQSLDAIYNAFPEKIEDLRVLDTAEEADAFVRVLERVDRRYLTERGLTGGVQDGHVAVVAGARKGLHDPNPRIISPKLTPDEVAFWKADVPDQVAGGPVKAQIWESMGIVTKLIANDLVRSAALEFDFVDIHGPRNEGVVRTMAKQIALPLARMIQKLKEASIWDRTVIAVYCVDGGREVKADSYGNLGKNTVLLAGGKIRGGYYGDLRVAADAGVGHDYTYHAPDLATGAPGPGFGNNSGRVPGSRIWRTVMKALEVPDALMAQFPDVATAAPLPFLLG
jgi:hypothetical protein